MCSFWHIAQYNILQVTSGTGAQSRQSVQPPAKTLSPLPTWSSSAEESNGQRLTLERDIPAALIIWSPNDWDFPNLNRGRQVTSQHGKRPPYQRSRTAGCPACPGLNVSSTDDGATRWNMETQTGLAAGDRGDAGLAEPLSCRSKGTLCQATVDMESRSIKPSWLYGT
jgi:hypothetical protein